VLASSADPHLLAHPLLDPGGLAVPPAAAAVVAMLVVATAARLWPEPVRQASAPGALAPSHSWSGTLSPLQVATRALAVGLLLLAIAAGRAGSEDQLENVAPALVVGAGWPLLLLGSAVLGPVWRWTDPWDGIARPLAQAGSEARSVAGAVVPAAAWAWYLSAYREALDPPNVGLALAVYSIVTVGGCLAVGRIWWLSRFEVFGMLFGWVGMRARLVRWRPPAGATLVLGVLAGGLAFGAVRMSTLWGGLNAARHALLWATVGVVVSAGLYAGLLRVLDRWSARLEVPGSVAAAVVPAVTGLAVALAMARNRLFTSVQLIPALAIDPFGTRGSPLARGYPFVAEPLGDTGLLVAQVAVLLIAHLAGAIVLARRTEMERRGPGMAALCAVVAAGMVALTAT
jgi:hypothetical protein